MKRWHFIVESILILVTLIFGIITLSSSSGDDALGFASWLMVLGFVQVFHSILLSIIHSKNEEILKWISIYWIAAILDLALLFGGQGLIESELIGLIIFPILPLILAVYLSFITWHFRRRTVHRKVKSNDRNAVFI